MVNLLQTRSSAVAQRLCDASCLSVVSFNSIKRQAQSSIISYTLALDLPLRKLNYVLFSSAYSLVRGFLCHKGRISLFQPAKKPGRKLVASRSKAGRKSAVNLLKTDFFFFLSRTRTKQRTCCGSRPGFRQKVESWSKACRKPARTYRKPGCKRGRKPGFHCSWLQ